MNAVLPNNKSPHQQSSTKEHLLKTQPSPSRHRSSATLPLAYQKGYQDFYGRDFIVTPDVLIPRPETEQIIDAVLTLAGKPYLPGVKPTPRQLPPNPTIIDIGTGSGCIAITLKKELPSATIYATDISENALKIAQKNAKTHGASIITIISHLLENVKQTPVPDLITANLPYVDKNWDWLDRSALSHEPSLALYAEDNGLALIKQLITQSATRQIKYLVLEADPCQHQSIITYAKTANYTLIKIRGFALTLSHNN
ncbi:peptide chain release factor N(5)-glutamine methyltransferase [Candidatus Saccharibacteria bacterium]|nr:peptide chain release factor N(5)-glutamine methyltransferase [Candidatus Saccharibacteria bacterium]